jgi:hypothetical protein
MPTSVPLLLHDDVSLQQKSGLARVPQPPLAARAAARAKAAAAAMPVCLIVRTDGTTPPRHGGRAGDHRDRAPRLTCGGS